MPKVKRGIVELEVLSFPFKECQICGYIVNKYQDKKLEEKIWNLHMSKHQH